MIRGMNRSTFGIRPALPAIVSAIVIASAGTTALAQQGLSEEQQRALRETITERFDVVPLTGSIALRPKTPLRDVRLIEVSDGAIAVNGVPVTGRELRERLGSDAEAILRLSLLDAAALRAVFEPAADPAGTQPPVEAASPSAPSPPPPPTEPVRRTRRTSGDRVRIFGDVRVAEDETVTGEVVAVIGSARIDGEVGNQVVAVLGSVDLGPNAIVRGDVVSVGGRVRRAPGAQIRGGVTEVSLGDADIQLHPGWFGWGGPWRSFDGFGAAQRLIGSGFRLLILMLVTAFAFIVARPTVEAAAQRLADDPVKSTVVGVAAQILVLPVMIIVSILLAITIVGIPLLFLLMPFVVLLLVVAAVVGFSGAAYAIGQWASRRFGIGSAASAGAVMAGVFVILLPLLLGRVIAVAGWPVAGLALILIAAGIAFEYVMWTGGFGAVITNAFSRWQARRATQISVQPPPAAS
jgi:hypothetical protein